MNEDMDFGTHWESTIGKTHKLLMALNGVGTSEWGMSPLSRPQANTGMIWNVA